MLPLAIVLVAIGVPRLWTHIPIIAFALQHALSLICHQRPDRSFWILGAPIALCARCLGIYIGAAVGLLLRTSRRIALQILIIVATLNILDAVSELAGLHGNWMTVRFVLGLTLGASGALLISSSMPSASPRTAAIS